MVAAGALAPVVALVDGRLTLAAFVDGLADDPALREMLDGETALPPYTRDGSLLAYILAQDPGSLAAALNVTDALDRLLSRAGVPHRRDEAVGKAYSFMLSVCPAWLSPPDWYLDRLRAAVIGLPDRKAQVRAARERIAADFRRVGKAPRWVQSPAWPFVGDRPLTFVGQLGLGDLRHDGAQVFVFLDEQEQRFQTIVQVA